MKETLQTAKELFLKYLSPPKASIGSVGIDIGLHSVKVVRLEQAKEGARIFGFAIEKFSENNYREALSRALVKAGVLSGENAAISVAGQGVVSRYVDLPMMNKAELESSMRFEIEKYIPFPLTEVASDYCVIHESKDKAKLSVLIAAAKNDLIQKKCNLAKEVNLNLKVIDLDCLALANFFTEIVGFQKKNGCIGIINLGQSISNIDILCDGVPHLSRDIFLGGDDITKKMSAALGLDYQEAEKLKIDPKARLEELWGIWDPVLNNLAAEIRVSLDYFETSNNRTVEKIFITGGASRLAGIEKYLNQLLGVEIVRLDYSDHLKLDSSVHAEDFKKDGDLLAIALGLALR